MKRKKIDIESMDIKMLILNLVLTQAITLLLAFLLYFLFQHYSPVEAVHSVLPKKTALSFITGISFSLMVVFITLLLTFIVPKEWMDDGGINEKLFKNLPVWSIAVISLSVGFIEEFLFRGAIQPLLGVFVTSLIFLLIHFRYLNKWVLSLSTIIISLGLGFLAYYVEWVAAFIAHSSIDFFLGVMIRKGKLHY